MQLHKSSESVARAKPTKSGSECPTEYSSFLMMHLEVRRIYCKASRTLSQACRGCSLAQTECPALESRPWRFPAYTERGYS
jgi:hypothetical protein